MVSTSRTTARCLAGVMGAAMAVSAGCNRGTETNTPATDSLKPAAVATAPADRKYLLERVDDAAVVQLYADGFEQLPLAREDAHLAPLPGGDRRPRHLLRPALRPQPRDARRARGDHHAPRARRSADARRDPALHQALLDQHRTLQQPHRAQVRAQVHAGGVRRGGRARPQKGGATFPLKARRVARPACSTRLQPMFFDPTVDPIVTNKTPAPGRTSSRRAPTICMSA